MANKVEIPQEVKELLQKNVPDPVTSLQNNRVVKFLETLVAEFNKLVDEEASS